MQFSQRTAWPLRQNRLTELLELRRREARPVLDLTVSNPTTCGFAYPGEEIREALSDPALLRYAPDPRGLLPAREAVCDYYRTKAAAMEPSDLFLTASTSEAYGHAFSLLCDPGDSVLVPSPSYPLFEYLAQLSDVALGHYRLRYDQEWHIDIGSMEQAITGRTRAIVLIHPHNPTGTFLRREEYRRIRQLAAGRNLALVVDEVFSEYGFSAPDDRVGTTAGGRGPLTLTLGGLSKLAGLPQLKLGWMALSGDDEVRSSAAGRLETICDTYLSVNTPVQTALPKILAACAPVTAQILRRVAENDRLLRTLSENTPCTALRAEGGWYGILRVPEVRSDEEWALELLEERGILVFPGYFFDLEGCFLVASLLAEPGIFRAGIRGLLDYVGSATSPGRR